VPKATDTKEVKDTELIGRSLYGKRERDVFCDRGLVKWQQFYDSRLENDLSVDRIGNKQIDKGSLLYLLPLAENRKSEPFKGWAVIKVEKMRKGKLKIKVYPSPVNDDANPDNSNELHADVDRSNFRSETLAPILAAALSHLVSHIANIQDNQVLETSVPIST